MTYLKIDISENILVTNEYINILMEKIKDLEDCSMILKFENTGISELDFLGDLVLMPFADLYISVGNLLKDQNSHLKIPDFKFLQGFKEKFKKLNYLYLGLKGLGISDLEFLYNILD